MFLPAGHHFSHAGRPRQSVVGLASFQLGRTSTRLLHFTRDRNQGTSTAGSGGYQLTVLWMHRYMDCTPPMTYVAELLRS
jgi:hypothetical protein